MSLLASHRELSCARQIGILSDIHANATALQKALNILRDFQVDSFLVCGDIVGYGQDVNECCEIIRNLDCPTVTGNHDLAVTGKLPFETMFTKNAVDGVIYAKNIITKYNFDWLAGLPVRYENRYLEMAHASLNDPMAFKYLALGNCDDDSCWENVQLSFDAMRHKMGIIGHSHVPALFFEHDAQPEKPVYVF
jgi:predicted phosphodiesterase